MSKLQKVLVGIAVIVVLILAGYLFSCTRDKPGMSGVSVTHGVIRMVFGNKDYIKIGENRYLYKDGHLKDIIENEYDSYMSDGVAYEKHPPLDELLDSEMLKSLSVVKNGQVLKGAGVRVWNPFTDIYSVYYRQSE